MTMDGRREDPHGHASCKPSPSSKCGVPRLRPDLIPPQVLGNCRMILRRRSMAQCNGICGNYRSTGTGFSWAGPITRSKHGVQYIPSLRLLFLHKYIYVHARTYVVLYIPSGKFLKEIGERTKGLDRFELCVRDPSSGGVQPTVLVAQRREHVIFLRFSMELRRGKGHREEYLVSQQPYHFDSYIISCKGGRSSWT